MTQHEIVAKITRLDGPDDIKLAVIAATLGFLKNQDDQDVVEAVLSLDGDDAIKLQAIAVYIRQLIFPNEVAVPAPAAPVRSTVTSEHTLYDVGLVTLIEALPKGTATVEIVIYPDKTIGVSVEPVAERGRRAADADTPGHIARAIVQAWEAAKLPSWRQ